MYLKKKRDNILIFAIVLSIMFVAGIPMIVLGAVNEIALVMILGIIFTVFGFYGSPFAWLRWFQLKSYYNIYHAITYDGITKVIDLISIFGMSMKQINTAITWLTSNRFLSGFFFDGNELKRIEPAVSQSKTRKCPNCGAGVIGDVCEHCGS